MNSTKRRLLSHCVAGIEMVCRSRALTIHRDRVLVLEIPEVEDFDWETNVSGSQEGTQCYCRVKSSNGRSRAFFLAADHRQANIREIDSSLPNLRSALAWLLPTGYSHRQGDIGIYRRESMPRTVRVIATEQYSEDYAPILHLRHRLEPLGRCTFYRTPRKYFVRLKSDARMVHPEHTTVHIRAGLYELIAARGQILSTDRSVRIGKPAFL